MLVRFVVLASCAVVSCLASAMADDWPQWLGPRRDGVWRETGIIERFPSNGLSFRWRIPVGAGYSGPSVAKGRIYLTDRQTTAGKTASRGSIPGTERILCLKETDGSLVWKHEYDCAYNVSYPAGRGPVQL